MLITKNNLIISQFLLVLLLLVAPFYLHPNIGGLGFGIPINSAEWLVALIFICFVLFITIRGKTIAYNLGWIYCLAFPMVLIFVGIMSEVPQPIVWLFRQLYLLGGYLFLFSLFQLKLTTRHIEQLLYIVVVATFIHSLVGICQLWNVSFLGIWLPRTPNSFPNGVFQQVNLQATYLTTGLLIILFLISRPSFKHARFVTKFLFITTFFIAIYVLVSSGSRIGVLSFVVGGTLMLLSRRRQLLRQKSILLILCITTTLAIIAGQAGLNRAVDKTKQLTAGEFSTARQVIYSISLDLIRQKPIFGYGIGSFPRVWTDKVALFSAQHSDVNLPQGAALSHPHNEVLFWMIEGGTISVVGLLIIFYVITVALFRCGFERGGAYAALLLPISLHTQVELPFYISSVHWFLWLFLIFMVFRHQLKVVSLNISLMIRGFIQSSIVLIGFSGVAMLVHIEKSQNEIFKYTSGVGGNLQVALHDLYFNSFAEKIMMQTLLYSSIEKQNKTPIHDFVMWAEGRLAVNAEPGMFIMLNDAYGFIGDTRNQCRIAKQGLQVYPDNARLQKTLDNCNK